MKTKCKVVGCDELVEEYGYCKEHKKARQRQNIKLIDLKWKEYYENQTQM